MLTDFQAMSDVQRCSVDGGSERGSVGGWADMVNSRERSSSEREESDRSSIGGAAAAAATPSASSGGGGGGDGDSTDDEDSPAGWAAMVNSRRTSSAQIDLGLANDGNEAPLAMNPMREA